MLPLIIGLMAFAFVVAVAATRDRLGLGLLLSSDVNDVAEARLMEPPLAIPPLYLVAAALAGAGGVLSFADVPPLLRWAFGVVVATFLLLTVWDMRRRRGTLAVYILLRRQELGFQPSSQVIEVPKLVFLVMNQPTPVVWLLTAIGLGIGGLTLLPYESWAVMLPLVALALGIFWLWLRNRRSPWEPLARRLRWLSLRSGDSLLQPLQDALDIDPEVILLKDAAEAVVARFVSSRAEGGRVPHDLWPGE